MAGMTPRIVAREDGLPGAVRRLPARDVSPVTRQTLATLLDLGMANSEIARYFRLEERFVVALRRAYCV